MVKVPLHSSPDFDPLLGDVTYAPGPYSDAETVTLVHLPSPRRMTRCYFVARKKEGPAGISGFKIISQTDVHARGSKKTPLIATPGDFRDLAKMTAERLPDTIEGRVAHLSVLFAKVASGEPPAAIYKAMPALAAKPHEQAAPVDPLAAARARGRRHALELYEHPDNLTLLDARDYAGRNERKINEQRQAGEVYALLPPGKIRGFRYPKWQFDAEPERLKDALKPFVEASSNCWVIHSFMLGKRALLDGRAPSDVIVDGAADLKPVIDLAEAEIAGEQGAQ